MSEEVVIARPYAKAVFDLAYRYKTFSEWTSLLKVLSIIASDTSIIALIKNPRVSDVQVVDVMAKICQESKVMTPQGRNFLSVLAKNHRLTVLPKIADLYEKLLAAFEKIIDVEVSSTYPITDKQQEKLARALEKKFDRKVLMHFAEDHSLLGGAVIRVGDYVIDGSVRGKLLRLSNHLNLKEKVCQ